MAWICDTMTADGIPAHHAVALGQVDAETGSPLAHSFWHETALNRRLSAVS